MSIFRVGNTVRHRVTYWGEPAYYITSVVAAGANGVPTGSKHGKAWKKYTSCLLYAESEPHYQICPLYMRLWLWLLGNFSDLLAARGGNKMVCDRCGAPRGMCPHAVEPEYTLQREEAYRADRRIIHWVFLAAAVGAAVIWRILA